MKDVLRKALSAMLFPVVRFSLKRGIGMQSIVEELKRELVRAAVIELKAEGQSINISRLSAATGVHRKDVARLYRDGESRKSDTHFITRVIGMWRHSPSFLTPSGRPKVLTYGENNSEFSDLVASVGSDLHPGTVLFELKRSGIVSETAKGLKLISRAYVPQNDFERGMDMLSSDMNDLAEAVTANLEKPPAERVHYHGRVVYDNIRSDQFEKLQSWVREECSSFHGRVSKELARFDLDINPNQEKKGGKRLVVGVFSHGGEA